MPLINVNKDEQIFALNNRHVNKEYQIIQEKNNMEPFRRVFNDYCKNNRIQISDDIVIIFYEILYWSY